MRYRFTHRILAGLIVLVALVLLFGSRTPWLPDVPLRPSGYGPLISPLPHFLPTQDDLGRRVYEEASIASYSVVVILTVLSLGIPLMLLFFNQVIDGTQSLMQPIFEELRSSHRDGREVPPALRTFYAKCLDGLNEVLTVATTYRLYFNVVVGAALSTLSILLFYHALAPRSMLLYSLSARAFAVSILLGMVVGIILWRLASKHYLYLRILRITELATILDPRPTGVCSSTLPESPAGGMTK